METRRRQPVRDSARRNPGRLAVSDSPRRNNLSGQKRTIQKNSFFDGDLKNDSFIAVIQDFLKGQFGSLLERVWFLVRSSIIIFIINPCVRIRESVKADNKKRLNLEGFEKIRKHRANYILDWTRCDVFIESTKSKLSQYRQGYKL